MEGGGEQTRGSPTTVHASLPNLVHQSDRRLGDFLAGHSPRGARNSGDLQMTWRRRRFQDERVRTSSTDTYTRMRRAWTAPTTNDPHADDLHEPDAFLPYDLNVNGPAAAAAVQHRARIHTQETSMAMHEPSLRTKRSLFSPKVALFSWEFHGPRAQLLRDCFTSFALDTPSCVPSSTRSHSSSHRHPCSHLCCLPHEVFFEHVMNG